MENHNDPDFVAKTPGASALRRARRATYMPAVHRVAEPFLVSRFGWEPGKVFTKDDRDRIMRAAGHFYHRNRVADHGVRFDRFAGAVSNRITGVIKWWNWERGI